MRKLRHMYVSCRDSDSPKVEYRRYTQAIIGINRANLPRIPKSPIICHIDQTTKYFLRSGNRYLH
ncbi:MAG: hypothetical protein G01um101466_267 [Parcubacteria group bacterium Gr01-1014_66]|nr:MAG: hypothetical protein G01um101466_267 [Parcubacteria group bacterium Gr01-1014_66]